MTDPDDYVVLSTVQGQVVEAQLKAFLGAHDIPCLLRGESVRVTYGIAIDGIGAAEVLVRASQVDDARELLARAERGELAIPAENDAIGDDA